MEKFITTPSGHRVRISWERDDSSFASLYLRIDTGAEEETQEEYVGSVRFDNLDGKTVTDEAIGVIDGIVERYFKSKNNIARLKTLENTQVKSLDELKRILDLSEGAMANFYIRLNGVQSWKSMSYCDKLDKDGNRKFFVHNDIDETEQVLSAGSLFNPRYSNIGVAIKAGQFYYAWT